MLKQAFDVLSLVQPGIAAGAAQAGTASPTPGASTAELLRNQEAAASMKPLADVAGSLQDASEAGYKERLFGDRRTGNPAAKGLSWLLAKHEQGKVMPPFMEAAEKERADLGANRDLSKAQLDALREQWASGFAYHQDPELRKLGQMLFHYYDVNDADRVKTAKEMQNMFNTWAASEQALKPLQVQYETMARQAEGMPGGSKLQTDKMLEELRNKMTAHQLNLARLGEARKLQGLWDSEAEFKRKYDTAPKKLINTQKDRLLSYLRHLGYVTDDQGHVLATGAAPDTSASTLAANELANVTAM